MQKYQNSVQDRAGDAVYGALITVTTLTGSPVVVFSNNTGTVLPAVITDDKGMFSFYVANGRYNLTVSRDRVLTYTMTDVLIDDSTVSTIVVDTFDTIANVAALKSIIGVTDKTTVSTLGYWTANDTGAGTYYFDLGDTTSVDNGGTVIVANNGGRWKLVHDYDLPIAQFGACTGTDDLTYITNAVNWANTELTALRAQEVTFTATKRLYTSNKITHPVQKRLNFIFTGGIMPAATWLGALSDPIIEIRGNNCFYNLGYVDCQSKCNGVLMTGFDSTIRETTIVHGKYYQFSGGGGSCYINVTVSQWLKEDPEFLNKANFTADGIYCATNDSHYFECNASLSLYPVRITGAAISNSFVNCHWWQGTGSGPGPVPVDPVIVLNESLYKNYMYDCYFDNGYVYMTQLKLVINGGAYIKNNLTNITEPWIRVFNVTPGADPIQTSVTNIRASIGFYNGVGSFYGDYTTINALTIDNKDGAITNAYKSEQKIYLGTSAPLTANYSSGRAIKESYNIGSLPQQYTQFDGVEELHKTDALRVVSVSGAVPHKILLGTTTVGISENPGGVLLFTNNIADQWKITYGASGSLLPVTDNWVDIGSTASRVRNVYAVNYKAMPSTTEALGTNNTICFKWIDDTHFQFLQRGNDGVTRSVTLTTA